ncbi:MAG: AAA family ATPase [Candidatus Bathyarchaeia archaeon]
MEKLVISISGKGGAGKTTVAALLLKLLLEKTERSILVVDADPATNLPDVLGVPVAKTVGTVEAEFRRRLDDGLIPPNVTKDALLEAWVHSILVEGPRFDLLAMGRSEGEGCYCPVNYILSKVIDALSRNYDVVLMDMEAGLEHLSRRTDRDVDVMLVVTDPSKMGLQTAARINELAKEVHISFRRMVVVGNQFPPSMERELREFAAKVGLEFGGIIPPDPAVAEHNMRGIPLLKLPSDSPSVIAAARLGSTIGLL